MPREGIFAQVNEDLRWGVKKAALDERVTVKALVTRILEDWLKDQGYFTVGLARRRSAVTEFLTLQIAELALDLAPQPRVAGLDAEWVRSLQECPDDYPPITVVRRQGHDIPVDGMHRIAARQNLGLPTISAILLSLTESADLSAVAFDLNRQHGKNLTLADKRQEVVRRLTLNPAISNMQLADVAGLSPSTVQALRDRLEASSTIQPTTERVARTGTTYAVSPARQLGELPAPGFNELFGETVGRLFTPAERVAQRKIVGYLQRLAVALEDLDALDGWEADGDAANACVLVLGAERARELADRLGWTSRAVLDVATLLGYVEAQEAGVQ